MATVTQSRTQTTEVPVALVCDRCGRSAPLDEASRKQASMEAAFEAEEFLRVDFVGGFVSVFGDEARVRGDFCQYCVNELLGAWLRVEE